MRSTQLKAAAAILTATVGAAVLTGCTSDEPAPGDGPSSGPAAADPVATVTTIRQVTGGELSDAQRSRLKTEIATVVDNFLDEAYLGAFPRSDFKPAYRDFTRGARRDAARDAALLSNADVSDDIESARATERRVVLEIFAPRRRAQGVTARFVLDYQTSAADEADDESVSEATQRVKGNLLLVKKGSSWRVFGYDVLRGVAR